MDTHRILFEVILFRSEQNVSHRKATRLLECVFELEFSLIYLSYLFIVWFIPALNHHIFFLYLFSRDSNSHFLPFIIRVWNKDRLNKIYKRKQEEFLFVILVLLIWLGWWMLKDANVVERWNLCWRSFGFPNTNWIGRKRWLEWKHDITLRPAIKLKCLLIVLDDEIQALKPKNKGSTTFNEAQLL